MLWRFILQSQKMTILKVVVYKNHDPSSGITWYLSMTWDSYTCETNIMLWMTCLLELQERSNTRVSWYDIIAAAISRLKYIKNYDLVVTNIFIRKCKMIHIFFRVLGEARASREIWYFVKYIFGSLFINIFCWLFNCFATIT